MKYKAILFDLDGTLLPMNQDEFVKAYFGTIAKELAPYGLSAEQVINGLGLGVREMCKNNGDILNKDVFWQAFAKSVDNKDCSEIIEICDEFYYNNFNSLKKICGENELAVKAVAAARESAEKVCVATNPIFPDSAQKSRLSWIGLSPDDFDLVTSYDVDSFCKPNPKYYLSICERIGVKPEDCLMIGNDVKEDMYAATLAGMDTYLVTDCIIDCDDYKHEGKSGTFEDMINYLNSLK